ncbi:MAG: flagellar filament capping protein FliD [Phycisphaerae bacterium]|nr:flagellar filament capping protein FliD [Phycisphaerae bacterium]
MSGVTSGVGLFSGIDRNSIIAQLLALEARPRTQAQARMVQFQAINAAYLDLSSRMQALKSAANTIRTKNVFGSAGATSSDDSVLTGTASADAAVGSYTFIVDRLVSTQQRLSKGFADKSTTGLGATSFSFESGKARLDREMSLSELNDGKGVERGKIVITDSLGNAATIDLSKAATVNDVLEAINGNGVAKVSASVQDGKFVVKDGAGGASAWSISNATGSSAATSLGIAATGLSAGSTSSGSTVYRAHAGTLLSALNDANGVSIRSTVGASAYNFSINVDGDAIQVNVGDVYDVDNKKTADAVTTMGGVVQRINVALTAGGHSEVVASIDESGKFKLTGGAASVIAVSENNSTTAKDLGILGSDNGSGVLTGKRVLAGINSTLTRTLNGGQGIAGDGQVNFTTRDGFSFSVNVSSDASLDEVMRQIATASGTGTNGKARLSVGVADKGTGLQITDNTGGTGNLFVTGSPLADTAQSLGISTGALGVASSGVTGSNLQHQYMARSTRLADLNAGKGVGTGKIKLTDSSGATATIDIGDDARTLGDIIDEINSASGGTLNLVASINSNGDGVIIKERTSGGAVKLKVEDESGSVAKFLGIAGTASGTDASNKLDGTLERTVTFDTTDTLQKVMDKINAAGVGVSATIINDGSSVAPFRLSLTSRSTGSNGRVLIDTGSFDLGLSTIDKGQDARVFFGSTDPARAVLLTSSTNTLDGVISNVKIDLRGASEKPETLTISRDTQAIEDQVKVFLDTFNTAVTRVSQNTRYDQTTEQKGALLGDSTALEMRAALFRMVQSPGKGLTGKYTRLADVGVKVGDGGTLSLDSDKFRAALQDDPEAVKSLFVAREVESNEYIDLGDGVKVRNPNFGKEFSKLGIASAFEELATRYVDSSDGILSLRRKAVDNQISAQNKRIDEFTDRLERRRAILEAQFIAMEKAIGQMQTQQQALGSLG